MHVLIALVARIYRALLRLYPADFRARHSGDMALDFLDGSHDARRARGWHGLAAHWARATTDLSRTLVGQWMRTVWPLVALPAMAVTLLGWSVVARSVPGVSYQFAVSPGDEDAMLVLLLVLGALLPIVAVIVFSGCFLVPNLRRRRERRVQ